MTETIAPGQLAGEAHIPASKSHTIRALLIASLAEGKSTLRSPLDSLDTAACVRACRALGASVEEVRSGGELTEITVVGTGGSLHTPEDVVDVGNSGTTLYLGMGTAALSGGLTVFTGDEQIRRRSAAPLLEALSELGATALSTRDNGCAPIVVGGGLRPAHISLESPTSQYLSSLLLAVPLARCSGAGGTEVEAGAWVGPGDRDGVGAAAGAATEPCETHIELLLLNERPYVEMTLWWLDAQGIRYRREGFDHFFVPAGQSYRPFEARVPGDFSSATFLACAAAITGSRVTLRGLDVSDPQGDKAVLSILEQMGCTVEYGAEAVTMAGPAEAFDGAAGHARARLGGGSFDLNAIPDALPALAATACFSREPVALTNVAQARAKETDRVAVMSRELTKMGGAVEERPDGLRIVPAALAAGGDGMHGGESTTAGTPPLRGAAVDGHSDHRVVMALAVAALGAAGATEISTAEAAAVTFPGFFDLLRSLHAPGDGEA
ncbi:MAG: 3-phosphoshikimate 1-carboxyvinyltransferase [Spirochaetia bacterium]